MPPKRKEKKKSRRRAAKPTQIQKQKQNVKINITGGGGGGPVFVPQAPSYAPQAPNIFNIMPPSMLSAPQATPSSIQAAMYPVSKQVETLEKKDLKEETPIPISSEPVLAYPMYEPVVSKPHKIPKVPKISRDIPPMTPLGERLQPTPAEVFGSMEFMPWSGAEQRENIFGEREQPTQAEVFGESREAREADFRKYSEAYSESPYNYWNITQLRDHARDIGVTPGKKDKNELIRAITEKKGSEDESDAGQTMMSKYGPPKRRGRKPKGGAGGGYLSEPE